MPTKFYTLQLRRRKKTGTEPELDEPDLLYLACKFGGEFEQFVPCDLERPRDWWHTRMNWLTWMTTEEREGVKPLKMEQRKAALRLSVRIEAMLDGEPHRVEETAVETVPDVPAERNRQKSLAWD